MHLRVAMAVGIAVFMAGCPSGGGAGGQDEHAPLLEGNYVSKFSGSRVASVGVEGTRARITFRRLSPREAVEHTVNTSWMQRDEWVVFKGEGEHTQYLGRVRDHAIELWNHSLVSLPAPLAFPSIPRPKWMIDESDPDRRELLLGSFITVLRLEEARRR